MGTLINNCARCRQASSARGRAAFTMIEMMVVMVIMAIMMAIAVAGYIDWGRGAGMRGSVLNTQSALSLARQWAVTHRASAIFVYDNSSSPDFPDRGYYLVATGKINSGSAILFPVTATNFLSEGIEFTWASDSPKYVRFKIDGTAELINMDWSRETLIEETIYLQEKDTGRAHQLSEQIKIMPLTGRCQIERTAEEEATGGGGR